MIVNHKQPAGNITASPTPNTVSTTQLIKREDIWWIGQLYPYPLINGFIFLHHLKFLCANVLYRPMVIFCPFPYYAEGHTRDWTLTGRYIN